MVSTQCVFIFYVKSSTKICTIFRPNGNTFTGEFIEDKKSDKGKYSIVYRVK